MQHDDTPDVACAQANTADTPSPWPFTPKFGTDGTFLRAASSRAASTCRRSASTSLWCRLPRRDRSSQSVDAQLKDFALGAFKLCGLEVTKDGDELSKVGDGADYPFTIENTGSVTLFKDSIIDDVIGDITDNVGLPATISNYVSNCGASLAAEQVARSP